MTVSIITSIIVWAITGVLGALTTYLGMRYKKVTRENNALVSRKVHSTGVLPDIRKRSGTPQL